MTVVAALIDGGTVHMAADGQSTRGDDVAVYSPHKVWTHLDGRMGMGTCGAARLGHELRYGWEPPAFDGTGDVAEYARLVARTVEDHLHASDHVWRQVEYEDSGSFNGAVFFGVAGRIFWFGGDFCVTEPDPSLGFAAIGSGGQYAEGALWATPHLAPIDRLRVAVEVAGHYVTDIGPPYAFLSIKPA